MKPQQKLSLIFWIFVLFCMLSGLTGCSKTEPSTAISETIKQDVKIIEKEIASVKENIPPQCRTQQLDTQLDTISDQVKNISAKVESMDATCIVQKEGLEQEVSKLKWIIFFLLLIGGILGYLIIKCKI